MYSARQGCVTADCPLHLTLTLSPSPGFKFVAEKVSHTPVVMAFHSEAKQGWEMSGYVAPSQKFWGRSMEVSCACAVKRLDWR